MLRILNSPYRPIFLFSLFIYALTSWFSVGSHHPDEHYQIIEFANYKLGQTPASDLAWEFNESMRPGLQPFMAYVFIKFNHLLGISDPFIISFLLRLISAFFIWLVVCQLVLILLPQFNDEQTQKLFVLSSLLLWFLPYINVHFSAENLSTILFLNGLLLLLQDSKRSSKILLMGFLFALSFYARYQIAFALVGVFIWLILFKKEKWSSIFVMGFGFLIGVVICHVADRWLYGKWVFSPYEYFIKNLVQDKVSTFGVEPWYYYFTECLRIMHVYGILLIILLFVGLRSKFKTVFFWIFILFFFGHIAVGHKEFRFLFPMWLPFIYLAFLGLDHLFTHPNFNSKWLQRGVTIFSFANVPLLLFILFKPASENSSYYKAIYKAAVKQEITLLCKESSIYSEFELKNHFYRHPHVNVIIYQKQSEVDSIMRTCKGNTVFLFEKNITYPYEHQGFAKKQIYSNYPDWLFHFNVNNWLSRVNFCTIYQFSKH
ncbi:MAG: hypothetical protein ACK50A_12355 [Sphingobacteriaceae bacterium]